VTGRRAGWGIAVVFAVAAIVIVTSVLTTVGPEFSLGISIGPVSNGNLTVSARITNNRLPALPVSAALIPGAAYDRQARPIYVFEDPQASCFMGAVSNIQALVGRVEQQATSYGGLPGISVVNASGVLSVLATQPRAILLLLECGVMPVSPNDPNDSALRLWLNGGGILVWAGGPLSYFEQVVTFPEYGLLTPGWAGQYELLGYPLTDSNPGPSWFPAAWVGGVTGVDASPAASMLGFSYAGVPYGANTTQVALHNGTDLGFDTLPSAGGIPRTSIAFIPVGAGAIVYFGGALWAFNGPIVPDGGTALGFDVAKILGLGIQYAPGDSSSRATSIGTLSSTTVDLTVRVSPRGDVFVVQVGVAGVPLLASVRTVYA
jgi:hypothetical protein